MVREFSTRRKPRAARPGPALGKVVLAFGVGAGPPQAAAQARAKRSAARVGMGDFGLLLFDAQGVASLGELLGEQFFDLLGIGVTL